jgi:Sigma-54 interaction domain
LATGKLTALSFGVAADDWNVLQTAHPNVLLIGSDPAITGFLQLLLPLLQLPIAHSSSGAVNLPADPGGTLILRDVQRLDTGDQQRLSAWMSEPMRRTQVISTASCPLYPLVESKMLEEGLFYSLNVIMLALTDPFSGA